MHLRRALLLFAIVLGLAAIASSISPPEERRSRPEPRQAQPEPEAGPRASPGRERVELRFATGKVATTRTLRQGTPATVTTTVEAPGQVELDGLGLTAPAEPRTPATFDVLANEPGRYAVLFTPAGATEAKRLGTLVVTR
jgi:hypothetical protein